MRGAGEGAREGEEGERGRDRGERGRRGRRGGGEGAERGRRGGERRRGGGWGGQEGGERGARGGREGGQRRGPNEGLWGVQTRPRPCWLPILSIGNIRTQRSGGQQTSAPLFFRFFGILLVSRCSHFSAGRGSCLRVSAQENDDQPLRF